MNKPHRSSTICLRNNIPHTARLNSVRINRVSGFTLIELMIALTLGLLIVAAGLSIFLSSQRSLGLQSGMDELQQNANFGLSVLTHDLRHTNLNTVSGQKVNSVVTGSGIIFKKDNLPLNLQTINDLETKFVTDQDKDTGNTNEKSDRLTIQYVPATDTIYNCEGTEVTNATSKVIVQRYYLAQSPQQITGEPKAYSLYCDAGEYIATSTTITGLNNNAQQIMQRIDAFKVRLGVKNPTGQLRYMTIKEYTDAITAIDNANKDKTSETRAALYPNVMSIEIGILARSTGTIGSDANLNTKTKFNLAGVEVELNGADGNDTINKKYLRQAVNQVVAIRNTLGAS